MTVRDQQHGDYRTTFVSNLFVTPETLATWLRSFVDVNPISILGIAMRGLMHG